MKTGFRGTFVISWSQTEVDGQSAAPVQSLETGAVWSWHGDSVRVDGPGELLRLDQAEGEANIRKRAARMVRRLVGEAVKNSPKLDETDLDEPLLEGGFVVTNGAQSYSVTVIDVAGSAPLLMFLDAVPPSDTELWVVHHSMDAIEANPMGPATGGVICFTPGTMIQTPTGPRLVQDLREGDLVQTKDNGAEEICWIGSRRMSGARLFALPKLRPVRFRAGALGIERPDQELLVSPSHRVLVQGATAQALFNTSEVLVSAEDLVNGSTITVDTAVREVTYVHLMLPSHQVLWANGVETESFHPANAAMTTLEQSDRARLIGMMPDLEYDTNSYGGYARRNLSASEAAILQYEAA
ncbi:Hint domain-containing protein [Shimia litoralis]|uniref:Hint domain-containing protein n=1 Tax=Shimia litoralis TaxID=420403 RepID=A0A4V6F158_9RHOB|nr:Hint domain-containing protein [Shimia litoralis]TKZ18061.1 Hint domain-containing protein [Shimia litoralis]